MKVCSKRGLAPSPTKYFPKSLSQNLARRRGQAHFAPKTPQNEPVPDGFGIGSKKTVAWRGACPLLEQTLKRRHGYTLVEMMAVIAVASAIAGVAVTALHTVLEAEAAARQRLQTRTAITLLARQFRADAHAAVSLTPDEAGSPQWEFRVAPEHRIRYACEDDQLRRTETVAGEVRGREVFRLPAGSTVELESSSSKSNLATLRILPAAPARAGQPPIRIDACLGMDRRFAEPAGASADPAEATP